MIRSATDFLPSVMTMFMNFASNCDLYLGSGRMLRFGAWFGAATLRLARCRAWFGAGTLRGGGPGVLAGQTLATQLACRPA